MEIVRQVTEIFSRLKHRESLFDSLQQQRRLVAFPYRIHFQKNEFTVDTYSQHGNRSIFFYFKTVDITQVR